ncbi:hypothetical protein C7999DRAFT_17052 [Corynascus novoguineensis]|uniref:Uncharacterized protein n=1 Tax=Corynascus novoguineensis TaxID=1126955 RepID=A0AAN7CN42_9PEZI|nr:hypothetical protein C7999DRAFT_17052 [Corynascus novoguineensis]
MCYRKIFIHHRCGHHVTAAIEGCGICAGNVECRSTKNKPTITNKYPCVVPTCPHYGKFN